MRSFMRRHAFVILLGAAILLACIITVVGVLLKAKTRSSPVFSADQLRPTGDSASEPIATLTATLR
jgi:hypothetical protein